MATHGRRRVTLALALHPALTNTSLVVPEIHQLSNFPQPLHD